MQVHSRFCDLTCSPLLAFWRWASARRNRYGAHAVLYLYSAKTLRAMLADAKLGLRQVDDQEALAVQELIDALTYELSTRKD